MNVVTIASWNNDILGAQERTIQEAAGLFCVSFSSFPRLLLITHPLCYLCVLVCSPVKFRKRDAALFQNSLLADEHLLRVESSSILRLWFSGGSPLLSPPGANALFCFHASEIEKTTRFAIIYNQKETLLK